MALFRTSRSSVGRRVINDLPMSGRRRAPFLHHRPNLDRGFIPNPQPIPESIGRRFPEIGTKAGRHHRTNKRRRRKMMRPEFAIGRKIEDDRDQCRPRGRSVAACAPKRGVSETGSSGPVLGSDRDYGRSATSHASSAGVFTPSRTIGIKSNRRAGSRIY